MSDKFKKSWLSAAIGGVLVSTIGSSAMAFDVPENETFNTSGAPTDVVTGAPELVVGTTSISGNLYDDPFGTLFNNVDKEGDEDAFRLYLDGTSAFEATIDFVDATLTGLASRPHLILLQDFGSGVFRKAVSNTNTDGTLAGTQTINFDPQNPSVGAGNNGVGGAGNYILLVTNFGNSTANPGGAPMSTASFDGNLWASMQDSGSTAAQYNATISGVAAAPSAIPVPAAVWLFGSGLMGLVGVARRRKA